VTPEDPCALPILQNVDWLEALRPYLAKMGGAGAAALTVLTVAWRFRWVFPLVFNKRGRRHRGTAAIETRRDAVARTRKPPPVRRW
jgi:hypothetical protein